MRIQVLACMVALLLALANPALAGGPVRCQTYPEPTLGRWQTVCDDGSLAQTCSETSSVFIIRPTA